MSSGQRFAARHERIARRRKDTQRSLDRSQGAFGLQSDVRPDGDELDDEARIAAWDADPEARGGPTFTDVKAWLASLDEDGSDERPAAKSDAITHLRGISLSALVGAMVFDRVAKAAAGRIWDRLLRHRFGPDDIAELVDDEVSLMRIRLSERQLDELGRGYLLNLFRRRVAAEGNKTAQLFAADCGGAA
ncbi:hypothetical protein [Aureimonas sp. AU22]|uniref:hypothetical protein n=1 Tax=Aureimonas sp. AU22 TaxID=1638162 RepID=UPI0007062811|nr:hypothetical protein [Aureimonas sp. AU22]BAT30105.1 HMG-CoA lyase-like protein [Aureimonas sp. AU22]